MDRPVRRATAYVTALGLYELHLNGELALEVEDERFAAGYMALVVGRGEQKRGTIEVLFNGLVARAL